MSFFTQFGSSAQPLLQFFVSESRVFTAPVTGNYLIYAIGGGGSGGASGSNSNIAQATGGGAGGLAIKSVYLTAGDSLSITIGAGGARVNNAGSVNAATAGSTGGITTVVGPGVSLTANGGSGGAAVNITINTGSLTTNGGAGGNATGGDFNFSGGRGGNITQNLAPNASPVIYKTGGGAVSFYGGTFNGGNIQINVAPGSVSNFGTGGAGVGGNGGNAVINNDAISSVFTGGGGAGGSAPTLNSGSATSADQLGAYIPGTSSGSGGNVFLPGAPGTAISTNTFIANTLYGGGGGPIPNTNSSPTMEGLGGGGCNFITNAAMFPKYGGGSGGGQNAAGGNISAAPGGGGAVLIAKT